MHDEMKIILTDIRKDLRGIIEEQKRQGDDISSLKVWAWIARSSFVAIIGSMFAWVRSKS